VAFHVCERHHLQWYFDLFSSPMALTQELLSGGGHGLNGNNVSSGSGTMGKREGKWGFFFFLSLYAFPSKGALGYEAAPFPHL